MMPRSVEIGTLTGFYSFVSSGGNDAYKIKLENLQDGLTLGGRVGIHFTEVVGFETSFGILRGRTEDTHRLVWYGNAHVGVDRRASGDSCYVSPLDPVS